MAAAAVVASSPHKLPALVDKVLEAGATKGGPASPAIKTLRLGDSKSFQGIVSVVDLVDAQSSSPVLHGYETDVSGTYSPIACLALSLSHSSGQFEAGLEAMKMVARERERSLFSDELQVRLQEQAKLFDQKLAAQALERKKERAADAEEFNKKFAAQALERQKERAADAEEFNKKLAAQQTKHTNMVEGLKKGISDGIVLHEATGEHWRNLRKM
jgi:hypothetical protein